MRELTGGTMVAGKVATMLFVAGRASASRMSNCLICSGVSRSSLAGRQVGARAKRKNAIHAARRWGERRKQGKVQLMMISGFARKASPAPSSFVRQSTARDSWPLRLTIRRRESMVHLAVRVRRPHSSSRNSLAASDAPCPLDDGRPVKAVTPRKYRDFDRHDSNGLVDALRADEIEPLRQGAARR